MRKYFKKVCSIALVVAMSTSLVNTNGIFSVTAQETEEVVFNEIETTQISDAELDKIAKEALADGTKAAKKVNKYKNTTDYEAALNSALTSYYEKEEFNELSDFEKTIDSRADEILQGYEDAQEERAKGDANGFEVGKVIAMFDGSASKADIEKICQAENGQVDNLYKDFTGDYVAEISISLGQTVDMATEAYEEYGITQVADANYYSETFKASDYVNDTEAGRQYYLDTIQAKEAWDYVSTHTHEKVLVGVIDTGVQINHYDLQDVLSPDSADVTRDDNQPVLLSQLSTTYTSNHGTSVSSVIAAKANNGRGIAGVASGYNNDIVEILAVQASYYDEEKQGSRFTQAHLVRALDYCAKHNTKVVNMSLGGYGSSGREAQGQMIRKMVGKGIIVVAAAGNDSKSELHYPSDFDESISVISTDSDNTISTFSNYGPEKDICAPGNNMRMADVNSGVTTANGTSFAAPVVSGVVAMMCSLNPDLNYFDAKRIMANTATELGDYQSRENSQYGVVNAKKCVESAIGYTPETLFEYVAPTYVNHALNAQATASSEHSVDFPVTNLVDGDTRYNSKFITSPALGQWMQIDLGDVYEIDNIRLHFQNTKEFDYSLKVSTNGTDWTEVHSVAKGYQFYQEVNIAPQNVRYIRLESNNNSSYIIISEIEAYGAMEGSVEYRDVLTEKEKPLEVLNMSANWTAPGMALVRWDDDANRISKNYRYNIYVDGVLRNANISSKANLVTGLSAGTHTFKVTALLNGYESNGTTITNYIGSSMPPKETTTPQPTTPQPTTAQPTTVQPTTAQPTTVQPTTVEETTSGNVVKPFEVIGLVVSSPSENTVGVVWGQDDARIQSGCRYNVYVNGEKKLNEVLCGYYSVANVSAGTAQVTVKSVLNGVESAGVTLTVEVAGTQQTPETTVEQTTVQPTTVEQTTPAVVSDVNIALNKPVVSSSNENDGLLASNVNDGSMGSRWSSAWTDNEWVYVDLQNQYNVSKIKLFWEGAFAKNFKLQVSDDATNWTDVATLGDNHCRDYDVDITPVQARYVRMLGIERGTVYGYSLYEMEVYATEAVQNPPEVTTQSQQTVGELTVQNAVASSTEGSGMEAAKAVDGNLGTRWSSAWNDNEWITFDLGSVKFVSDVELTWEAAFASEYKILVSNDGTQWTEVKNVSNGNGGTENVDVNTNARYVKIQGVRRATPYGYSIFEAKILGY